jgi:hypothetical protein
MKHPLCRPALFLAFLLSAAQAATLDEGLVGWWRFGAQRGSAAADSSPTGNALQFTGPQFQEEAKGFYSLRCDGFETSGRLDERKPLRFSNAVTLSVWVRPERSSSLEPVVGRPNAEPSWTTPTLGFALVDGEPLFGLFTTKGKLALQGPRIPLSKWTHLLATCDGTVASLWVDGQKVAEQPQRVRVPDESTVPWYVGRAATQFFRGRIGEIRVWARGLAPAEVAQVFGETQSHYPNPADTATPRPAWPDRTTLVASPGSKDGGPWRERPTRTLEGLDGFTAPKPVAVDKWGGRMDRPALKATGFFRCERGPDRWWLVTPEGHLYWNIGVNTVTIPAGVPANERAAAAAARVVTGLREMGFNGISSPYKAQDALEAPLPWCARVNFAGSFAKEHGRTYPTAGHVGFAEQCVPVFHPDFPAWCRRQAEPLRALAGDPLVMGIFTDNELQCPPDLLDRHLKLDPADPYLKYGRAAALAWLAERGLPAEPAAFTLRVRYEFIAYVFGTYSRIAHDAVRACDPNHLILGSRFATRRGQFDNPWFWRAIGPWMDVVAVNYYSQWGPQRDEISQWGADGGKPIVFSEWYAKAMDAPGLANAKGAGWLVRTQEDRGLYYQHFALAAMELPAVVGIHYFKYLDDPAESVALDAAGGANKGLYTSRGEPWVPLQRRARAVNTNLYPLLDFFTARARPNR